MVSDSGSWVAGDALEFDVGVVLPALVGEVKVGSEVIFFPFVLVSSVCGKGFGDVGGDVYAAYFDVLGSFGGHVSDF